MSLRSRQKTGYKYINNDLESSPLISSRYATKSRPYWVIPLILAVIALAIAIPAVAKAFSNPFSVGTVMTNVVMNNVFTHVKSGDILPTHSKQLLESKRGTDDSQTTDLPLGVITDTIDGPSVSFTVDSGGPWNVVDLEENDYTSTSDTAGTRVIRSGYPEVFGDSCGSDLQAPDNDVTSSLSITGKLLGILNLNIRSSTEANYDFVSVKKNDEVIYSSSGSGPSASNGYLEDTLQIIIDTSDIVVITFSKDYICWGGYDVVYFYASFTPLEALSMTLPSDLSTYIGKTFEVCSNAVPGPHTVSLPDPLRFDSDGYWRTIKYNNPNCCATFSVTGVDSVHLVSQNRCALMCTAPNMYHCVDPLRPYETSPFHGWWKLATKTLSSDSGDVYGYFNAAKSPPTFETYLGTPLRLRRDITRSAFDLYSISPGIFSTEDSTNIYDPFIRPMLYNFQPDRKTLVVHRGMNNANLESSNYVRGVYEKVDPPKFLDDEVVHFDSPVAILRNFFEDFVYAKSVLTPKDAPNELWPGYETALTLMDTIINDGTGVITTPIEKTLTTPIIGSEGLTQFFTLDYHHIVVPARVTVSGFSGSAECLALNGVHLVSSAGTNNRPYSDSAFEDAGVSGTVHNVVAIHYDSSAAPVLPNSNILDCGGSPTISVSYGPIDHTTEYLETMGAIHYWFYETAKMSAHQGPFLYYDTSSGFSLPAETWERVAEILASPTESSQNVKQAWLRDFTSTSAFYMNPVMYLIDYNLYYGLDQSSRYFDGMSDYFGRYGIRPDYEFSTVIDLDAPDRSTFNHILSMNYLEEIHYPVVTATGTSKSHPINLASQAWYGTGGDEFEISMIPFDEDVPSDYGFLYSGTPTNFGDWYRDPVLGWYNYDYNFYKQAFFVGRIKSSLTSGTKIGYIRWYDMLSGYTYNSEFAEMCPTGLCDISNPRNVSEPIRSIYAPIMQYLINDLECEHIILDIRANGGGFAVQSRAVRNFLGSGKERFFFTDKVPRTDNGYGPLIDITQFNYPNNLIDVGIDVQTADPDLNDVNYPGSVLTNAEVVILTDTVSFSAGDEFPNAFLGPSLDGQLGDNTQVHMVGSVDGRIAGYTCSYTPLPVSQTSPRLRDSSGNPVSIYGGSMDCGYLRLRNDGSSLAGRHPGLEIDATPSLSGSSGSNALPADWETLNYPDLGFTTNSRPVVPGWTGPQTPSNNVVTDPLSTTVGSNVVTVDMGAPHGFASGDVVTLGSGAEPVSSVGGIPGAALTGAQTITVTGANTFTFEATYEATYPGFQPTPATSTVSNVGGNIRIMNRNQWRDAWLEQSILKILDVIGARRRRNVKPKRRAKSSQKKRSVFDRDVAKRMYGRDVGCGNVQLTPVRQMAASKNITIQVTTKDPSIFNEQVETAEREIMNAIVSELQNGGMCLDSNGALMATPTCSNLPRIVFVRGKRKKLN